MTYKQGSIASSKPDKEGKVVIKLFLLDEDKKAGVFPVNNNRKEEIVVEDATVGNVYESIRKLLFSEGI